MSQGFWKPVQALYKKISDNDKKMIISSLLVQKQPDRHLLLWPFQIAFTAEVLEVLDGKCCIWCSEYADILDLMPGKSKLYSISQALSLNFGFW